MTVTTENSTENPTAEDIDALRVEIDHLDAEILRLVKRRTEVSKQIGKEHRAIAVRAAGLARTHADISR